MLKTKLTDRSHSCIAAQLIILHPNILGLSWFVSPIRIALLEVFLQRGNQSADIVLKILPVVRNEPFYLVDDLPEFAIESFAVLERVDFRTKTIVAKFNKI